MKKIIRTAMFALLIMATFASCTKDKKFLSQATGRPGEVIVVIPDDLWNNEGSAGSTIRDIFSVQDTILPRPEDRFRPMHVPPSRFNSIFQIHRNILFIDVDKKKTAAEVSTKNDEWSKPQTIIYVTGPTPESINDALKSKGKRITEIFENAEIERFKNNAANFDNRELRAKVEEKYGYSISVPKDFDYLGSKGDFMWLGYQTNERNVGVFIYSYPYTNEKQLSLDSLIAKRNEFLKQYVLFDKEPEGSAYMTTTTNISGREPQSQITTLNGEYAVKIRGLWKVQNDFMGGPFVSYTTIDKKNNRVITFDGFVYAPSRDKLNLLRQIDGILLTAKPKK